MIGNEHTLLLICDVILSLRELLDQVKTAFAEDECLARNFAWRASECRLAVPHHIKTAIHSAVYSAINVSCQLETSCSELLKYVCIRIQPAFWEPSTNIP